MLNEVSTAPDRYALRRPILDILEAGAVSGSGVDRNLLFVAGLNRDHRRCAFDIGE